MVNGLVLGGGQSSRMGFPKFKVVYIQSQPQWQRLALAMQELVVNCGINIPRNEENNMGAFQEDFQKGFQGDFQGTMKSVCDSEYDGKYKSDSNSNSDSNADTHSCSDTQRVIPIAISKIDDLCDKISWEFDSNSMVNSGPIGGILSYFNQLS
jgi:molybdopterin-guanine dinucleotide biosynthesis protein A